MKRQYRDMVNTRRLYKLETDLYNRRVFPALTKQRSLRYLRKVAKTVWKREGFTNQCPEIRFGIGMRHGNEKFSWCDGETVELAPKQQDVLTLIHELVHAIGHDTHDKKFVTENLRLLKKYFPNKKDLLTEIYSNIL